MINYLQRFYYTLFGNLNIASLVSVATILLIVGVVILLSWQLLSRNRLKAVTVFLSVTLCTVSILSLLLISPLPFVRYNAEYSDLHPEVIDNTKFDVAFGALKYSDSMEDGKQYTAYVGSSGATMVVVIYPDNCSVLYQGGASNNIYVTSNEDTEFTYTTITVTTTSVREVEQTANTVTRVTSVRDMNIVTTADIYDYAHPTEVLIDANY